ncbi:MAG: ribosome biogenesis GTPase Der [Deltaproteobacteria bacterium]|nr:MAG: ribosome biogenesis GTPase Der [Deltaproteobacteria bacterium]
MTLPVVAIVGRPNVGKSTLFNRLVGFRKALVHDRPGVTRDRLYEKAEAMGKQFMLIDTGGLEPAPDTGLLHAMRHQTLVAIEEADIILLVVDARAGETPADSEVVDLLRRSEKPVLLVVNKIDGPRHDDLAAEFWSLGFEEMFPVSASHGRGMWELHERLHQLLPESATIVEDAEDEVDFDALEELAAASRESEDYADDDADDAEGGFDYDDEGEDYDDEGEDYGADDDEPEDDSHAYDLRAAPIPNEIRIAVLGRPNIGKSTLVNTLLGHERHLVHDMPGTTMDPVDSMLEVDGERFLLVDTAGVRRKSKIDDKLERFVSLRSIKSIERCHISLLVIDGTIGPTDQDAKLAKLVADRGRGLIILVNKWDLAKNNEEMHSRDIQEQIERKMPHAAFAPFLFISAKTGKGTHRILPMVKGVFGSFNRRIPTGRINKWLDMALLGHSPPQRHHHPVKIYYAAQARVRPPTLVFFCNTPEGIHETYQRYLERRLREQFSLEGSPVRLHFRKRRKLGEDE